MPPAFPRGHLPQSRARTWLSTTPVLVLLLGYLVLLGTLEQLRSQLLAFGVRLAPGYTELRTYPTCEPCPAAGPAAGATPKDHPAGEAPDDDPFAEGSAAPSAAAEEAAHQACVAKKTACDALTAQATTAVRIYRAVETRLSSLVEQANAERLYFLVLLLLIGATSATALRAHIGLRPVHTLREDRASEGMQLAAHALLFASWFSQWRVEQSTLAQGVQVDHPGLPVLWMVGLAVMSALNVWHLARPAAGLTEKGTWLKAPLAAPLYATMGIVAGLFFLVVERHPSGLAIYLEPLTEHSSLYFQVGLYGWAGMLLIRTRVVGLIFDSLRPFQLPPELLVFVVVVGCAFPTAYTGASGIFVIASGAVIFEELRRAGVRQKLALASTAMSGSLGVVLAPCLLVMIIAELNKEVTPDQIYKWGWRVFGLSAVVFLGAILLTRREKLKLANPRQALPQALRAARPMLPFVAIAAAVLTFDALVLGTRLDEHSAPTLLPILLLLLLAYDRWSVRRQARREAASADPPAGALAEVNLATGETAVHIGALLMLMGLSACVGGAIERSELVKWVPTTFGSPLLAMGVLVVVLVIMGMLMDPYGAVILVSSSVDDIAIHNGIAPVHFWIVVLVAFELGYLLPPVALNQLLARKVIGPLPEDPADHEARFWRRHEDVLLPIAVLAIVLVLVAFVPLFWPSYDSGPG